MTVTHVRTRQEEARLRARVAAQLALLGTALARALRADDPTAGRLVDTRQQDVEDWLQTVGAVLIQDTYQRLTVRVWDSLVQLATDDATQTSADIAALTGTALVPLAPARIREIVATTLFPTPQRPGDQSATLGTWWERQADRLKMQLHDLLLVGVTQGISLADLVDQVVGTEDRGFADGLVATAQEAASGLLRTAVTNTLAETRSVLAAANPDAVQAIQHTSVLDGKTSLICLGRDGLRYTADTHEPIGHTVPYLGGIPYHFN